MTSAIFDVRPAAPPGIVPARGANSDLVHLFALDRLPLAGRRQSPVGVVMPMAGSPAPGSPT